MKKILKKLRNNFNKEKKQINYVASELKKIKEQYSVYSMDDLVLYKKHIESIISEFKQFGMLSVCIGFYFSILALILNATFEISQGAFLLIVTIMSLGILFVVKNYYSGYRINYIKKEIIEMIINERLDGTHTKPVKKYRNRLRK